MRKVLLAGVDHRVDQADDGGHRAGAGQARGEPGGHAFGQRAELRRRHHHLGAQPVDAGDTHQRTVLDALAGVGEAIDDDTIEGCAQLPLAELGTGDLHFTRVDLLLVEALRELLFGHLELGLGLVKRLPGDEVATMQVGRALEALAGERQAGFAGADLGGAASPGIGHIDAGALDLG